MEIDRFFVEFVMVVEEDEWLCGYVVEVLFVVDCYDDVIVMLVFYNLCEGFVVLSM